MFHSFQFAFQSFVVPHMRTHEALPEFAVVGDLPLARSAIVMRKGSSPLSSASFSMRFSSLMTFVPCPLLELPYLGKEKIIEVQRRCAHLSGDTITLGSEPRLRSASARGTNTQPVSRAYSRMLAWTVLCSVGVDIFFPSYLINHQKDRNQLHKWLVARRLRRTDAWQLQNVKIPWRREHQPSLDSVARVFVLPFQQYGGKLPFG